MKRRMACALFAMSLLGARESLSAPDGSCPGGCVIEGQFEVDLAGEGGGEEAKRPRRITGTVRLTLSGLGLTTLRPMPGPVLHVLVVPWAELFVDGETKGRVTSSQLPLDPGDHSLRLEHPGFEPLRRKVSLLPGHTQRLIVDLTEEAVPRRRGRLGDSRP